MQQTQIIPHIRAISYGFTFSSKSWSHDKPKFYHIFNLLETQIIPHFRVTIFLFSLRILITCQSYSINHKEPSIYYSKPRVMSNESKIWVMSWWLINDENEKNKWIIENEYWTSQIIVVRKCGKICVSNKLKMWQNSYFSRDQGFGEKIENIKWLEYVAKFVFAA